MLNVGDVIAGGFAPLRQKPLWFLAWAVIYFLGTVAIYMLSTPVRDAQLATLSGSGASTLPGNIGLVFLGNILLFLAYLMIYVAALRALLRPDEPNIAGFRLGGDEARVIGLAIFLGVILYIGIIILALVGVAAGFGVGFRAGAGTGIGVAILIGLAVLILLAFFGVRLSLALPLTFIRQQFVLAESWRLTRGRYWTLFAAYLVLFLILFGIGLIVGLVIAGAFLGQIAQGGFSPQSMQSAAQAQLLSEANMGAMFYVILAINSLVGVFGISLWAGAAGTAARALITDTDQMASTFA